MACAEKKFSLYFFLLQNLLFSLFHLLPNLLFSLISLILNLLLSLTAKTFLLNFFNYFFTFIHFLLNTNNFILNFLHQIIFTSFRASYSSFSCVLRNSCYHHKIPRLTPKLVAYMEVLLILQYISSKKLCAFKD